MGTYEVGEGIEFLAHEAGLVAPAGYFAVEEVEEQAEGEEGEGRPEVGVRGLVAGAVAEGGEDGEDSAEAWGRWKRGLVWRLGENREGLRCVPFISVMRSARCIALMREKWPPSAARRFRSFFWVSAAARRVSGLLESVVGWGERARTERAGDGIPRVELRLRAVRSAACSFRHGRLWCCWGCGEEGG